MRLLTIQLLLLGTQLISAEPPGCEKTHIKGAQDKEYTFSLTKELTCNDGSKEIEVANIPKKRYAMLNCDVGEGWKDGANKLSISATKDITIKCKTKACDESLITGYDSTKMKYDASKTLKCNNAYEKVKYSNNKLADKLECKNNKWMADAGDTGIPGTDEVTVAGCKIIPCHKGLVDVSGSSYAEGAKVLTCIKNGELVKIGGKFYGSSLTCDDAKGWTPSGILATEKVTGKCEVDPTCTTSLPPAQITAVSEKYTCTPVSGKLKALEVKSAMHSSLTCDGSSWTSPSDSAFNEPADTLLQVTCVDYCQSTGGVTPSVVGDTLEITCPSGGGKLFYTLPGKNEKIGLDDPLKCSLNAGWTTGGSNIAQYMDIVTVECVKACSTIKQDDGVNGLTSDAKKLNTDVPEKHVFKCNDVTDKRGIKLNDNLVNSDLFCDATIGYYDIDNKKLADAFDEVTISCGKSSCEGAFTSTCHLAKPEPEGFLCNEFKKSPEEQSDDFNFLQCNRDKTDNLKLYLKNTDTFLDKPLRCEGDNFYEYGDSTKTTIATKSSKLFCVQKICGLCKAPTEINPPPSTIDFTDGSSDECAKAKCLNGGNLWSVEYNDGSGTVRKEYSGTLQCSSVEGTKTKWLISRDVPTPITKASCVTTITSCNEAAPLKVDCEESWKERGCERIIVKKETSDGAADPPPAPSDDTGRVNTCSDGLKMFYKQPNDGYALNDKPADTMVCDRTKGWELTINGESNKVYLQSGGTIVCAKENPSPVTTTTPPTTTTPFVNPCDVCPQELYSCDKCSEKKPQFNPTSDNEKCQAMALASETSFETEKEGLVKGKLSCDKSEKIWKTEDGKEVGKFALPNGGDADTAENTGLIIGGAVGGVVFLIAILAVIFYVLVGRKKAPKEQDEETKRKMLEESKKRKKTKDGDNNDEILDEVAVDAPAEIKL